MPDNQFVLIIALLYMGFIDRRYGLYIARKIIYVDIFQEGFFCKDANKNESLPRPILRNRLII